MFRPVIVPLILLLLASCGRPEFGATAGADEVIVTDVDRADPNASPDLDEEPDHAATNNGPDPDPSPPFNGQDYGAAAETFAFDAYRGAAAHGRNAVIAPHGLARSLVIAHAAAGPDLAATIAGRVGPYLGGDVYSRFNSTDQSLEGRQADGAFRMLAGVWVQENSAVEAEFVDVLARYLGLQLRLLDFSASPEDARNQINNWYSSQTGGRISEVLGPRTIGNNTRFVVTDATWFGAEWGFGGFDASRTTYATFAGTESNVQLPMMGTDAPMLHFDGGAALEAVVLPFSNGFSLIAVLPQDLDAFESALDPGLLERIVDEAVPRDVMLEFPRIEVSDRVALSSVATAIGVDALFAPEAEYLGFADGTQLDDAHQRTRIAFTEVGIDVQTDNDSDPGTGGEMTPAPSTPPVAVSFNRPFFFGVRDSQTGRYLFLGRVTQP